MVTSSMSHVIERIAPPPFPVGDEQRPATRFQYTEAAALRAPLHSAEIGAASPQSQRGAQSKKRADRVTVLAKRIRLWNSRVILVKIQSSKGGPTAPYRPSHEGRAPGVRAGGAHVIQINV